MNESDKALGRLLAFIDEEQSRQCEAILEEARGEARTILASARRKAREMGRQAVGNERQRRQRELGQAAANVNARLHDMWFRIVRRELDQAWPDLESALRAHWQASAGNRRDWLGRTLETATHALGPGLWTVSHPLDWDILEGAPQFHLLKASFGNLEVHPDPQPIEAGFVITCGDAVLSTTVSGLLSRRDRIEGLWLAILYDEQRLMPPDIPALVGGEPHAD